MNKRFSTLMAAALVAGGLSTTAFAGNPTKDAEVKSGSLVHLQATTANVLGITKGAFIGSIATPTDWAGKFETNLPTLWRVNKTEHKDARGTYYTYSFQNKATGDFLAVKLESDNKKKRDRVGITPAEKGGNTEWLWDATTNGLYAYNTKVDSVFAIAWNGTKLALQASPAASIALPAGGVKMTMVEVAEATTGTGYALTAADVNVLLKKNNKKLFFTGDNVSTGKANVLTDNVWTAVGADITNGAFATGSENSIFLHNDTKFEKTGPAKNETKYQYLVVDYKNFYDAGEANPYLLADTIALDPTASLTAVDAAAIAARTTISASSGKGTPRHPFTAAFTVKYHIAKDSLVIAPTHKESKIAVSSRLAGRITELTDNAIAINANEAFKEAVAPLLAAVGNFYKTGNQAEFTADMVFATAKKFAADGSVGSDATGQSFIDAIETLIEDGIEYSETAATATKEKAYVAAVEAFIANVKDLKIVTVANATNAAVVSTKTLAPVYSDGKYAALEAAPLEDSQVVIRKTADVKVLTVDLIATLGNIFPAIKTSADGAINGNATIAAGMYYVVDKNKMKEADANAGYGMYFAENGFGIEYAADKQAFNPWAVFEVANAAGSTKGNYTITPLAGDVKFAGVMNNVNATEAIYVAGPDTFQLLKATDVTFNKHMGYKFLTVNEEKQNKFSITSAIDVLGGYSLEMKKDSSFALVKDGETMYSLVAAGDAEEWGTDAALEKQAYYIQDAEKKGSVMFASNKFFFSKDPAQMDEEGTDNRAKFYLLAVGSDSTFVLTAANGKMYVDAKSKAILSEANETGVNNSTFLVKAKPAPVSLFATPKHITIETINNQFVALNKDNQAIVVAEGALKAGNYATSDFTFWLDTAAYNRGGETLETVAYYVTKGVAATETAKAQKLYMYNAADSAKSATIDKEQYSFGGATRVIFRTAERYGADSLIVAGDTLTVDGKNTAVIKKAKAGVNNFRFNFTQAEKQTEGVYNMMSGDKFLSVLNGTLVIGANEAQAVMVEAKTADAPTSNEGTPSVSAVSVIASEGQITIAGAEGKRVAISNILGQVIANQVISSSNATITAPAGIVVVAVEGEAAVKAIVK